MDLKYFWKEAGYYKKLNGLNRALKKFLLTGTPFKKIMNTGFYNWFYSKTVRKKAGKIQPRILQIENTNLCNAKCVMCPHVIMKRKGKIMPLEDFKKIVDNVLKSYKIERLTISGFGEPFVDSGLIDKIKFINKKYPKLKVDIYTNASLLKPEVTDKLLKTKADRITFSVNGTEKNYRKIMGLDYKNTEKNILYFLGKNKNVLTNISLMILKENEKDVKKFLNFWRDKADSVRVYLPSDWAGSLKIAIQKSGFKSKRWACFGLFSSIVIDVQGNVIMCCRDFESKVKFGNLLKQDIKSIRNGRKFQELLKMQLNCDFSSPVCSACDNSFDSSLDWIC